jgi:ABC-type glutathione transport system ATPase component
MADILLEARRLSKTYAERGGWLQRRMGGIRAVDDVSCVLRAGERLGLVGESGCGKTTLAKLLVGLIEPTAGDALVNGLPIGSLRGRSLLAARRTAQFVFQNPLNSLNPRLTVEETLREPLQIHGLAARGRLRQQVEALLAAVQLPAAYRRRIPAALSGGEQQRVGIARALAVEPNALICDEPISSLDVSVGAQILALLRQLSQERGTALLFISHDLRAVGSLCDRIAVMKDGRWIEEAPTETLLASPRDPYTRLLLRSAALDLDAV